MLLGSSSWLTAVGVPVLLAVGGLIAWGIRTTIEDYREAERQLTDERRALYQKLLEPFVLPMVMADDQDEVVSTLQSDAFSSPEYRRAMFEMTLFASDDVVRAFGDITNSGEQSDPRNAMVLWGRLLLAIRKSVGNKGTQLKPADMLRPTINDLDSSPDLVALLNQRAPTL